MYIYSFFGTVHVHVLRMYRIHLTLREIQRETMNLICTLYLLWTCTCTYTYIAQNMQDGDMDKAIVFFLSFKKEINIIVAFTYFIQIHVES